MRKKNNSKKIFFLVVLAFFVTVISFGIYTLVTGIISYGELNNGWDGESIATSFKTGNGSSENPYVISNAEEFIYFKSLVEGESYTDYQDKYYILDEDINLSNHSITPIGMEDKIFTGNFNGKGHTIKNFNITEGIEIDNITYYSLFSQIKGATIQNVNISDYHVLANSTNPINVSLLVGNVLESENSSTIHNIAILGFELDCTHNEDVEINTSLIANNILGNTNISNIYLGGKVASKEVSYFNTELDIDAKNIITNINYPFLIDESNISSLYTFKDGGIYLGEESVIVDDLINSLNKTVDSSFYWTFEKDKLYLLINNNQEDEVIPFRKNFSFSIRSMDISIHDTELDTSNHAVYINNLTRDLNYYMGLNYTEIRNTNGTIPSGDNQNIYTDSNLATIYIRYSSADINDSSIYGSVSVSEDVRDYYYYSRYPVVDGYVTFDLIDNPWANRPSGRAFNGWVSDYPNAVISLDMDTYVRSVRIPVSDVSSPISITFYSSWTLATVVTSANNITSLKTIGMTALTSAYEDLTNYYISASITQYDRYPNNNDLYDLDGNSIVARSYCQNSDGCTYLIKNTNNTYVSTTTYYRVTPNNEGSATVEVVTPRKNPINYYTDGTVAAGYFVRATSGTENVYSSTGTKLTSCGGDCYKLLQYSDGDLDPNTTYYYLTTRDTNIYAPTTTNTIYTSDITVNRPMTITGINNGVDNSNNRLLRLDSNWTINSDLRIEFIRFYTNNTTTNVTNFSNGNNSYKIIGNYYNLKLGRGLARYNTNLTATSFVGGSSSASNSLKKYSLIVESGFYQNGSAVGFYSAVTHRVEAKVTLGSDYDRVDNNNSRLIIYYCYAGTWASNLYNSSSSTNTYDTPAISTVVKSGSFGTNHGDYAAGIYAGGRGSGTHYALRAVTVEGGSIYNLIGGPMSSDSRASKNDIIINVKAGTIDMVFGGAGVSDTVGNRILNITGGTINYGVLGGSNAYDRGTNTNNPYGKIDGDTLLYVGGNVTVGTQNDSLYNISSGDVFGAGNGRDGELDVGSVNNSNVIIGPSANIKGNVYGGGNFGAVGGSTNGNETYTEGGDTQTPVSGAYEDSTSDKNIRYFGSSPDNYIQFNGEVYRIIGLFNNVNTTSGSKDLVRIVKNTSLGNRAWSDTNMSTVETNTSTETSGGWYNSTYNYTNYYKNYYNYFVKSDDTKSLMYNYLNTTYYNGLDSTYRDYIQEVTWNLGATNSINQTASQFYSAERGNGIVNYLTGINQTSNGSSSSSASFKVGLFYPSDYGFANSDDTCIGSNLGNYSTTCRDNNWMSGMTNAWTMIPSTDVYSITRSYQVSSSGNWFSGYTYTMNRYYHVVNRGFITTTSGLGLRDVYYTTNDNDNNNYYNTNAVYPSFYLKDDVTIVSGTGTSSDPYIIGESENLLTDILEELVAESPVVVNPVEDDGTYQEANDYQARTKIKIIGGTVEGSVYGAGNSNGAGNKDGSSVAIAKIDILMTGGKVDGSIYGGANARGIVYGDVLITAVNGTVGESIYGGGKGGYDNNSDGTYIMRDVDVVIGNENTSNLKVSGNVYGGSAFGTVNGISQGESKNDNHVRVTVNAGVISGSVFGGGEGDNTYTPNEYGNVFVHINGGNMTNVFGGNDSKGSPSGYDVVYLNGGIIGNCFGGGNNTGQDVSDIRLQGATITGNLYGGSNASGDVDITQVTVSSGSVVEVYGGNNLGGEAGDTFVTITGGNISTAIYGGGKQAESNSSHVTITGCSVPDVYGGGKQAGLAEESTVTLTNVSGTRVFGGSNVLGTVGSSNVTVTDSSLTSLYGGNNAGGTTTNTQLEVTNSSITNVYGGGDNAASTTSRVKVNSGNITHLYGGGNEAGVGDTTVIIDGGTFTEVFGGSNRQGNITSSNITISGGNITSLYGGNNLGGVTSSADITATGGTFATIYGGGNQANVGNTSLSLDSITASNIYGGGKAANITGNTVLDIDRSTVSGNVFGGGDEGEVDGSTTVALTDTSVGSNVYAGGNLGNVGGNSTITIDGDTTVGSSSSVAPNEGCVFGSGNAASTGTSEHPGVATVNIVGGKIFGNVYGGPKMAVVYGVTNTNIGTSAVNMNGLKESDIIIHGTVFGGGESNASGSETYDYTFISVTNGINVNINGTGYIANNHEFIINGSIFGSGNASSSAGDSNITIKNLGSVSKPNQAVSIQRATNLVIDASVIELSGTTDRTNEYSDILYSFNLIDRMVIKNGTTLLLQHNANMLKELYSGVDSSGTLVPATVDIDDDEKTVTKNVDNRIYMNPGQNLHVTVNQSATAYGRITGMTFFGMYTYNADTSTYRFGLYDPSYTYGSSGNAGLEIVGGSYVIGQHHANHDITKDGFYTNILDEETYSSIITQYIDPSPIGETGYRWIVGFEALNYTVPLTISKYSSLGTYELSLIDFTEGDSIFTVIGFDTTELDPDLELVDSNNVPRIGTTIEEANGKIGLAIKVETQEWTGTGTTKFYSRNGGEFSGDTEYRTDSRSLAPSLMFYSYHAKNFSRTGDLGNVVITMEVLVPKNAIEYTIKYLTITVELDAQNYGDGAFYDASITYDKKYEMPAATSVNITNQSQFTAYFSLTEFFNNFQSAYGTNNTYYHVLTTSTPLPVDTMITMLDYGGGRTRPEYYYFRVTQAIYDASVIECETDHQASYPLSNFIKMDSTSPTNTYSDSVENLNYYTNDSNFVDEEFIFIVDFKETTTTGEHLNNHISFELRNADGWSIVHVVGIRDSVMNYNLYQSSNVVLKQTFTDVDDYLYYNVPDEFHYSVNVMYNETLNRESVIDTNYEYSRMGLNVMFYDRTGEAVSSSLLIGTSVHIANQEYFADGDGVFRIKLANKVSNIEREADVTIGNKLPAGTYTIRYILFASSDGLHNSTYQNSVYTDFNVTVVSSDNYISAACEDYTKLVYGETGLNHHGDSSNTYTVTVNSNLTNPNYRVEIYKRDTDEVDSVTYTSVPFNTLFVNSYNTASGNEIYLNMGNATTKAFTFSLADELTSGTYRVVFRIYDTNQLIDEDVKYVIVQKSID